MAFSPRILMYGSDQTLIETRRWVLERSGFLVRSTLDLNEASQILSTATVDVFLLCHSLQPGDRESALAAARLLQPEMKNLIMEGSNSTSWPEGNHTILDAFSDTRTLISTLQRISTVGAPVRPDLSSLGERGTGIVFQTH